MWQVLAIGAVAAGSVFIGMPLARSPRVYAQLRTGLTSGTVGILLFLLVDLLSTGNQQVLAEAPFGIGNVWVPAAALSAGFVVGFAVLPLAAAYLTGRSALLGSERARAPAFPGVKEVAAMAPFQLSLLTAVGIGMHNFAEGLAIGSTYATGVFALSVLLVFGVIAHKLAEGFCICGCASTSSRTFSMGQLGLLGIVGGGPTLLGVIVGGIAGSSASASTFVLGLAGGALFSVVFLIHDSQLRGAPRSLVTVGLVVGFLLAFVTDLGLTLAGF